MYEYRGKVLRVVDGDTLHLEIDVGLDMRTRMTVRLAGINAPEMSTSEGVAAKQFVEGWVLSNANPDGILTVRTAKDRREKYGRYLATLLYDPDSRSLNDALIDAGHAVAYMT